MFEEKTGITACLSMAPAPVGTPVDIAFGAAVLTLGAAALVIMGNGFKAGAADRNRRDGIGLPGASGARRARDKDGNQADWPPKDSTKKSDDKNN